MNPAILRLPSLLVSAFSITKKIIATCTHGFPRGVDDCLNAVQEAWESVTAKFWRGCEDQGCSGNAGAQDRCICEGEVRGRVGGIRPIVT